MLLPNSTRNLGVWGKMSRKKHLDIYGILQGEFHIFDTSSFVDQNARTRFQKSVVQHGNF